MTDQLIELVLSNVILSAILAAIAYLVHRHGRYPAFSHLLWVLVLLKLVTPPLLLMPLMPSVDPGTLAGMQAITSSTIPGGIAVGSVMSADAGPGALAEHGMSATLLVWAIGSVLVLVVSLIRIVRFDRLLRRTSVVAPVEVRYVATLAAAQIGLRAAPTIYSASGRLSPMTWWTGGRVMVVLPTELPERIGAEQLRWVLAHELAHVKRRDHLVRWLEWLVCVAFWWNPIVWWARRNLRIDEEVSCDALVLDRLEGRPHAYAGALLSVVEFLAGHPRRPPAIASGIDAGGPLETRFARIVAAGRIGRAPRWLVASLASTTMALMALSVGHASPWGVGDEAPRPLAADAVVRADRTTEVDAVSAVSDDGDVYTTMSADVGARADIGVATRRNVRARRQRSRFRVFVGTAARDTYGGSDGRDRIDGGRGADDLSGGGRHDRIRGGRGADSIAGGAGPDRLAGGPGNDIISGGSGRDRIRPGSGRDIIDAGGGNDIVRSWRDGAPDSIDCGDGERDRAIVDSTDSPVNCEVVTVRDPS